MAPIKIVGIILIVAGAAALAYGGFSYTKETHKADIGPLHVSVAEKDRDTVHRVIKLTAESIKFIQTNRDATKKIITKWMPMKDADLLEDLYRFATENYAKEGFTPEGALRAMTKQMVQSNLIDAKAAASTPVTAYYDNRYVDEVKRSGFFEQLWR